MKKTLLALITLSSLAFSNDIEKQIPELFNKMLDNFEKTNQYKIKKP